ncbi:MAG: ubiquinone biosynthesis protein UbiB, partial [Planctomycetes bacterium]|nr:ubiquinone biosynthesis protein UbiB [Planctomycetota bacterium]
AFASFDREPLAAGSIGQVHRAVLHDGREVIVKIRRPGIQAKIEADLRLLRHIAELLESEVSELRRYRPVRVQRQFARSIKAELNFVVEAKNLRAIQQNLPADSELETPEMVWDYSCERLLVQTRLAGISAADWMRGKRDGDYDTAAIAAIGADAILRMVFIDGVYHADPHPGNIVLPGGRRVGLLDFGMVGRLTENRRREFAELLKGVAERDVTSVAEVLLSWADSGTVDFELLQQDCEAFLDRYSGVQLQDLDVAALLLDLASIMRENDLAFPADVSMLIKVFVTLEGLGRALHPQFDLSAHLEPLAKELVRRMGSPRAVIRRGTRDVARILAGLPHDVRVTLDRIRRGNFKIELDLQRLDSFGHQLDRSANRVTVGMILASMIIGTAIAMTIDAGPKLWGMPAIGLFGFLTSAATSAGLLWSIFRSGRHR